MEAEGTAALGDVDERIEKVGEIGLERRELVDHEHEAGKRFDVLLILAILTMVFNLVADILYAVIDPRIRYD